MLSSEYNGSDEGPPKEDLISIHESCYEETFAIDTLKRVHETYFAI